MSVYPRHFSNSPLSTSSRFTRILHRICLDSAALTCVLSAIAFSASDFACAQTPPAKTATSAMMATPNVIPHFVVNTNADDSGTAANCAAGSATSCSLRDALTASRSAGGTITFDSAVFSAENSSEQNTITLGSAGTLAIPANTTITGATSGSGVTMTNLVTVSGNNSTEFSRSPVA